MSNKEKGTAYELLTQSLYQTLMNAEGFKHVKVEHDKTDLVGRSSCAHQIDVYWEYELAGHLYRTAIECKAFDSGPVSVGRIRDFYGVLADTPGLQGIFVTTMGYQAGAKLFADHYGITLKELRVPTESDWAGRVQDIYAHIHVIMPNITKLQPNFSKQFIEQIPEGQQVDSSFKGTTHDSFVIDAQGNHVVSVEEIRLKLPASTKNEKGLATTLDFSNCFLKSVSGPIPIDSVTVDYDVIVETKTISVLGEEIAKAIIKDVKSGEVMFFDQNGGVKKPRA